MSLVLIRKAESPDDFTVEFRSDDGRKVYAGRIFFVGAGAPKETPWMWTVSAFQRKGRMPPHQGHTAEFEAAKEAFKRCWDSANVPIDWPPNMPRGVQ